MAKYWSVEYDLIEECCCIDFVKLRGNYSGNDVLEILHIIFEVKRGESRNDNVGDEAYEGQKSTFSVSPRSGESESKSKWFEPLSGLVDLYRAMAIASCEIYPE